MTNSLRGALCAVAVALVAAGAAGPAVAASVWGGYTVSALTYTCNVSGQGSGTISEQTPGCAEYIVSGAFQASGSGAASHDTLRATARVGFAALDPSGFIGSNSVLGGATAKAGYTDTLVIDIAGRTGEIVELVFETALHGALSAVADYTYTYAEADASLVVNVNGVKVTVGRNAKSAGTSSAVDFNPGRVQIALGSPFSVGAELSTLARVFRTTGSTQFYTGDAVADFFNSGGITSFTLFEAGAGGALISDWSLSSESGQFGFYTAVVPVPGAAWLLATGLAALAGTRRARAASPARAG